MNFTRVREKAIPVALIGIVYTTIFLYFQRLRTFESRAHRHEIKRAGDIKGDPAQCKLVLSSYIYLPPEQKQLAQQPDSLMNFTCTYLLSILNVFGRSAEPRLIGWKSSRKFYGFISKVEAARLLAASLAPDTILMMTDAFDVIVQKQVQCSYLREILEKKYHGKMVFVGEKQCYPLSRGKYMKGEACKDYPVSTGNELSRRLNGGSWVGFAQHIVRACDVFLSNLDSWKRKYFREFEYEKIVKKLPTIRNAAGQDQYGFAVMYLYGDPCIVAVDTDSDIFITESGYLRYSGENRTTVSDEGFLFDTISKRYPAVIHFNAGKDVFKSKVKFLPWMQNFNISLSIQNMPIFLGPDLDDESVTSIPFKKLCLESGYRHEHKNATFSNISSPRDTLYARFGRSEEEFNSLFSEMYCSFMIRECVNAFDIYRTSALAPMPQLPYYNASVYGKEQYLDFSSVYEDLFSVPPKTWGKCAFVASGAIRSEKGKEIDSYDTVIRTSTKDLSKMTRHRGCKVDILIIKPHRRRYNQVLDPCESGVKMYWEPSPVFTYGSPTLKHKGKSWYTPKLLKERPVLKTLVNYNFNNNSDGSPPYPLHDRASAYVEELFAAISKKQKVLVVPSSGFRFLVQLIMSGRCSSIVAYGFSGKRDPVYFSSGRREIMSPWHDPALELQILRAWGAYKGHKDTRFHVFHD